MESRRTAARPRGDHHAAGGKGIHGPPHPRSFRNRILRRLPASMLRRLRKDLKEVELRSRDSLYQPNASGKHVDFPETGVAAMVTVLKDGTETEVATVGDEGMVGLP